MLRFPRPFIATNVAALFLTGGGGGTPTSLNANATPTPGTTPGIGVSGNTATGPSSSYGHATSLGNASSGLVHVEITPLVIPATDKLAFGICNASKDIGPGGQSWVGGNDHNAIGWYDSGGVTDVTGASSNDVNLAMVVGTAMAIEIDFANSLAYFMKSGYRSIGYTIPAGALYLYIGLDAPTSSASAKFGPSWSVTPTSGYTGIMV